VSVRFAAATDAYTAGNGAPGGSTYSGVCWAYATANPAGGSVLYLAPTATGQNAWYLCTNSGSTQLFFSDNNVAPGGYAFALNTWYQLGFVVSGTSVAFFAASLGSALTKYTATSVSAITPTRLFLGSDEYSGWWPGRLAGVKLWNVALTDDQMTAEFTQFRPVSPTGLLRYHRFVSASTADDSGLGNTLTAGSTATTTDADPPGVPELVIPARQLYTPRRRAANW
jgi:hypothetical protein